MSFTLELPNDLIAVDAGSTAPVVVVVKNQGETADQFELQVEGVDGEWLAIPVPVVAVDAGANVTEKFFFKPPRESQSLAGNYPFAVKVRSLTSGESRTVQAVLAIKPFHHLTMEVSPKKGSISPTRKDNVFAATIMNLGNTEHSLQLFGNDPENALTYTYTTEQITLGPGQTKIIEIEATPSQSRKVSSSRLHGFTLGARSMDVPSIACSAQAQLEQRPLATPGSLAVALVVILLFFGWFALLPKPARIERLTLDKLQVVAGDPVTVSWRASNAQGVDLRFDGRPLSSSQQLISSFTFAAQESGTITAVAIRDGKESPSVAVELIVTPKPIAPDPKISEFEVTPLEVNRGDRISIKYKVDPSVTELILQPTGEQLDLKLESRWITANFDGETTFYLVARNVDGKEVQSKKIKVTVTDATLPKVKSFVASPTTVENGISTITLTWNVANGATIELAYGTTKETLTDAIGTRDIVIDKTTEFTLSVTDSQGRKDEKKVTVTMKPSSGDTGGDPPITPPTTGGGH